MATRERGPTRAMLQAHCELQPVQNSLKLQSYFNGARNVLLQGESYLDDGDMQQAYVFLKRFLTLGVKIIPSHNAFNNTFYSKDRAWLTKERKRVFGVLETVSLKLDEADAACARDAAAAKGRKNGSSAGDLGSGWWEDLPEAPTGKPPPASAMSTEKNPKNNPANYSARHIPGGPLHPARPFLPPSYQDSVRGTGGGGGAGVVPSAPPAPEEGDGYGGSRGIGVRAGGSGVGGGMGLADAFSTLELDQNNPSGEGSYPQVGMPRYQRERPSMRPRPSTFDSKRRLVMPTNLVEVFERIARPNTNREPYGIETCGILAGRVTRNILEMTTLIIPKQEGTSDSCSTTDEIGLFNYMLSKKLITLGWIHTHPMQQCFMSSVDLHTHCGYQLMLPEAVAIVYAPCDTHKRIGVFRLTEPGGMKLIQECKLKGFHMHPEDVVIYEDAQLDWSQGKHMAVADLR